ncbi:MAG: class I SAM-dependent methyltransferase [Deltaproteobacteria bacterium]|nr:class I SAM-dependent methyltransferase [Deltaproteobacteria bacterium]
MAELLYNTKLIQTVLSYRRQKRVDFVLSKVDVFSGMSILDVGCGPDGRSFEDFAHRDLKIVGVDILDEDQIHMNHPNFQYFKQDAQDLSRFADHEFDLCVSFGMMEHICDHSILRRMYSEIDRVSKQWIIVVPWKYAIIEPHFKFPFFQLLPYFFKITLTRTLNLHGLRNAVREDYNHIRDNYQWLTSSEWIGIFQGGRVYITPYKDTIAIVKHM